MTSKIIRTIETSLLLLLLSIFIGCNGGKESKEGNIPSQDLINQAKAEVADAQRMLPIEGGLGLLITSVDFDDAENSFRYKYNYTVPGVNKLSETQLQEAKQNMVYIVKSQPKEMNYLRSGISFHYDYYSVDNEYLYSLILTKEDIADN